MREFATPDFLGREKMVDFTRKLSKQIGGLMRCGEVERITSGEFIMLAFTCGGNDVNVAKRTGAPVGHSVMEEGTVLHMRYAGVPKNSRSPNAGALLIHYLMSAEGQELLWRIDGLDLHLFPGSQTKRELDRVRAAKGKVIINSPEWLASFKDYAAIQKELEGILRQKCNLGWSIENGVLGRPFLTQPITSITPSPNHQRSSYFSLRGFSPARRFRRYSPAAPLMPSSSSCHRHVG
jgi:hypothetical protein